MRRLILAFVIGLAVAVAATGARAEDPVYLFDLLKDPAYKASWDGLFAKRKQLEPWIAAADGPSGPVSKVTLGGEAYTLADLCKPHDCGDNQLKILFGPGGTPAYAMLTVAGEKPKWFGKPPKEAKQVLRKAGKGEGGVATALRHRTRWGRAKSTASAFLRRKQKWLPRNTSSKKCLLQSKYECDLCRIRSFDRSET